MIEFRHAWRGALIALVTAATVSTVTPAVAHAAGAGAAAPAPVAVQPLIGGDPVAAAGVVPATAVPGPRPDAIAKQPAFSLRHVDGAPAPDAAPGFAPDGEGGGYGCTPHVGRDIGAVGEDDYLEETVTVFYQGAVQCNFYLWSITAAAGVYDRSDDFNGEQFDGDIISVGPTYYTEWDYEAYSSGGFGVLARGYNGAREIEPGFEMILEAPEGFVWEACEPLPGLRYLEPCDGLGTNTLYTLVGAYDQSTGLTKACRDQQAPVDVEQARVTRLQGSVPVSSDILRRIPAITREVTDFKRELCDLSGGAASWAAARGQELWNAATTAAQTGQAAGDDRPLYWARLSMTSALSQRRPVSDNAAAQTALDRASRGMNSHSFATSGRKVFVSGFDPFGLDGSGITRGNPSGAAALALDGKPVGDAEVQAVVFPVRYADFAAGLVEQVFGPHITPGGQQADLVTTVSQGREGAFDLEFYNGRARATNATDNLGVPGGGSLDAPITPAGMPAGEQFVATTLPVDRMRGGTAFPVRVNTSVRELTTVAPRSLCTQESATRLRCTDGPTLGSTAVEGGGDSYLSNEIAYRVTRLRDQHGVGIQAGHVHTPTLCVPGTGCDFDARRNAIVGQYRLILEGGVGAPGVPAVRLTADRTAYQVGESPVYTVTGGPNADVEWSGVRDNLIVERDIRLGHTTGASGTWTGSWHQWLAGQEADWVRWVRVGGRLARVAMTVSPAQQLPPYVAADFDGDGRTDVAVWRPSDGTWYTQPSSGGFTAFPFGVNGDLPVDADFDGDRRTDPAVYRPSNNTWYFQSALGFSAVPLGIAGDVPMIGDYDGDGRADPAVFRPSDGTWHVLPANGSAGYSVQFGQYGDVPVHGDFDGDRKADLAVFRYGTATWWVLRSSDGQVVSTQFGLSKDILVPADYDGDGRTDLATFRKTDGRWRILQSSTGTLRTQYHGGFVSKPAPGDYDGDGRADFAHFTPGTGSWQILHNTGGTWSTTFGLLEDIPIAGR